jgi:membrane protein DedA with SNARE-associated domain
VDPLGSLIDWIATYGVFGLFAIGLAERFIPALPSYGVLVAIGIAAVDGAWSITVAIIVTTTGSICGALALYLLCTELAGYWACRQHASIKLSHHSEHESAP